MDGTPSALEFAKSLFGTETLVPAVASAIVSAAGSAILSLFLARYRHRSKIEAIDRQHRGEMERLRADHSEERKKLEANHKHELTTLAREKDLEYQARMRQFEEADHADRQLVQEFIDGLVPRLREISGVPLNWAKTSFKRRNPKLAEDWYRRLQQGMQANPVDAAYPERSVSLRIAFRIFQLVAAMRLALNAPRTRVVSEKHRQFLDEWNSHVAPVLCSPDYPGEPLLFREQLEIIANEMLVKPNTTDAVRPVDWSEFVAKYTQGGVIKSLADIVCERIAFICHDGGSMRCRRLLQCRLAILGLYLIRLSKLAGKDFWSSREPGLWSTVRNGFRREARRYWRIAAKNVHVGKPKWYVFKPGDAGKLEDARPATTTRPPAGPNLLTSRIQLAPADCTTGWSPRTKTWLAIVFVASLLTLLLLGSHQAGLPLLRIPGAGAQREAKRRAETNPSDQPRRSDTKSSHRSTAVLGPPSTTGEEFDLQSRSESAAPSKQEATLQQRQIDNQYQQTPASADAPTEQIGRRQWLYDPSHLR